MQKMLLTTVAIISTLCQTHAQAQVPNLTPLELPGRYFQLLKAGIARVAKRLVDEPEATLASLEKQPGWAHFPSAILMPAVRYSKLHSANKAYGDADLLRLAQRIGDMLVTEYEKGSYTARGDNDWDTYMWLEAYRVLENKLGEERRMRWREVLLITIGELNLSWPSARTIPGIMRHSSLPRPTTMLSMHPRF